MTKAILSLNFINFIYHKRNFKMTQITQNETLTNEIATIALILPLDDKAKLNDVIAKINELVAKVNDTKTAQRNRGPESTREMTEADARLIMIGEHKELSHKDAAAKLGLSYGQVYSARGGYTFKAIYKEANKK